VSATALPSSPQAAASVGIAGATPDIPALYQAMLRCSAVYEPEPVKALAAFAALGCTVLGRFCNDSHQAVAHRTPDGRATLTHSGTRVSEGTLAEHFCDLAADVDYAPLDLGDGVQVATGAHDGLDEVWAWAISLFGPGEAVDVEGHSLGGQRACLTPLYLPPERIRQLRAFEPPKAANAAFWARYAGACVGLTTLVHGRDPWAGWPWISEGLTHQPAPLLWLHDGTWSWSTTWQPGTLLSCADHGPDSVVAALAALAAPTGETQCAA
jgi:hypothetical protein